jgi:hypothetical protein
MDWPPSPGCVILHVIVTTLFGTRHASVEVIMRCLAFVALLLALAAPATAQVATDAETPRHSVFNVATIDLLVGAQAGLHTADMFTTAYALHLGTDAREANPLLAGVGSRPVALAAVSGAVDVLQAYVIVKLEHRHPRMATVWALALVATECWATANNIHAIGELQRRSSR